MRVVDHHLVGDNVRIVNTPNVGGRFADGALDTLVMHFTAGSSVTSSVRHMCKKSAKASAHLVIGRDGSIFQLAPFNIITWHAGHSSWNGRQGLNNYSLGIELDNAGELTDNGNGRYLSWFNRAYTEDEVYYGQHRNRHEPSFWHTYTEVQIEKTFEVCQLLCDIYRLKQILGHEEIAPGRKLDPGPAFPLDRMREQLLTDYRRSEDADKPLFTEPALALSNPAMVRASKLNIRTGPGVEFALAGEPLLKGSIVKPLNEQDGWTEVEYTMKGWVSSQYISELG